MQVTHQPNNCDGERDCENDKYDPAFAPRLAERTAPLGPPIIVAVTFVLQSDRNIKTAAAGVGSHAQFFSLPPRSLLRDPRRIRDYALEFFNLVPQVRFPVGQFFLFSIQRRGQSRRATKHEASPGGRGHPEKKKERDKTENDQGQTKDEANLQPLKK
jgi:hypothetical protein